MPVAASDFIRMLSDHGICSYYGIPDSLLKELSLCFEEMTGKEKESFFSLVCADEGSAVAMAIGSYISSNRPACVYMQNSGIGNALNPLVSLACQEVYSMPMLLVIGWRGEPGIPDEPQHELQGAITLGLLEMMRIPYIVLEEDLWEEQLVQAISKMQESDRPVAVVIKKGFFAGSKRHFAFNCEAECSREEMLRSIVNSVPKEDIIVATTGKCSRELFEIREQLGQSHDHDLLVVGGMGHASSIAFGISRDLKDRDVWCLDGDGALLMHAGSLVVIAQQSDSHFKYIVNKNGVHESVGGQTNAAMNLDLVSFLESCGFKNVVEVRKSDDVQEVILKMHEAAEPTALVLETVCGSRDDLGRPSMTPFDNIRNVMQAIREQR